jgi:REP element-mobilizing transposase RayT
MVIAYHVIFSTYGFWLPNDPRGSGSNYVGSKVLLRFGRATPVTTRRSVAAVPHDSERRRAAKRALRYPPVFFSGIQARAVGRGFGQCVARSGLTIWACAILPDHVHLVIARHRCSVEQMVTQLKGTATRRLLEEGLHPGGTAAVDEGRLPPVWGRGLRKVFINNPAEVRQRIAYVEQNPLKEGKPRQHWSFVTPYDGRG